jgi:hypothetical protein
MKVSPMEAKLFDTDRRADKMKRTGALRNFVKTIKNNYDTKFEWSEFSICVFEVLALISSL